MHGNYKPIVIISFLLLILAAGIGYFRREKPLSEELQSKLGDVILSRLAPEYEVYIKEKLAADGDAIAVERAEYDYQIAKLAAQEAAIPRYESLKFWGLVGTFIVAGAAGIIVATGYHNKLSTFLYIFGDISIPVKKRDLSTSSTEIAMALATAKQIEAQAPQRAFQMYLEISKVQSDQIKSLAQHNKIKPLTDVTPQTALPEPNGHIPTFAELLTNGDIAPGKPMILGYEHGVPRRGSFLDIYSAGAAGETGSGKTATLLFLIGSGIVAEGTHFKAIDPHYPHPKSLGFKTKPLWEAGLMEMATYVDDMLAVLDEVVKTIDTRLRQGIEGPPVVLVIDELAFLAKSSIADNIFHTMERISTEGRKCGIYMLASSQTWLAVRIPTVCRDTLTSAYVHSIKPKQANFLLQDQEAVKLLRKYVKHPGDVLLCPVNSEPVVCKMPLATEYDMQTIVELVGNGPAVTRVDKTIDKTPDNPHDNRGVNNVTPPNLTVLDGGKQTEIPTYDPRLLTREILNEKVAKYTKAEVARGIGVSSSYLIKLLTGKRKLTEGLKQKFSTFFRTSAPEQNH